MSSVCNTGYYTSAMPHDISQTPVTVQLDSLTIKNLSRGGVLNRYPSWMITQLMMAKLNELANCNYEFLGKITRWVSFLAAIIY